MRLLKSYFPRQEARSCAETKHDGGQGPQTGPRKKGHCLGHREQEAPKEEPLKAGEEHMVRPPLHRPSCIWNSGALAHGQRPWRKY